MEYFYHYLHFYFILRTFYNIFLLGLQSTLKGCLKEKRNAQTTLEYCKITEIYNVL